MTPPPDIHLADHLSVEQILVEMEAPDRAGAIAELVEKLDALGSIPREARGTILASLLDQEHQQGTGIGSGVAIPHCYSNQVESTVFIFGRSKRGLDFQSPDGESVHFILLYIIPDDRHLLQLQTLRAVSRAFLDARLRQRLHDASDAPAMLEAFRQGSSAD